MMKPKYTIPLAGVVVLVAALWLAGVFDHEGPSVILISVDTLRPDHLGCYGYARRTSPSVDAFAGESNLFLRCFSQAPSTRPSCGTIVTGYYPHELKIFGNSDNLSPAVPTLAERLREEGYRTIGVVSNFVLRRGGGFEQGFDYYDDKMDDLEINRGVPERIAEKTTETAISLLRLHHRSRFFLWIHYQDPHGPYTPPPPFDAMFAGGGDGDRDLPVNSTVSGIGGIPSYQEIDGIRSYNQYVARYDGEIRYFDEHFGRLVRELKALDLYDKALIVLTADHGEGMGEHDYYFAHGEYVYDSLIHVPLIIHYGSGRASVVEDFVQLADVVPTILSAAGIDSDETLHGSDILRGGHGDRSILSEMPGKYSVIEDGLKLIHHTETDEYYLFDIANDPDETTDLLNDPRYAGRLNPMALDLVEHLRHDVLGDRVSRDTQTFTRDEKEKLKALGYIQ
jgi:arylsulfatase A-like enzyme